MPLQEAYQVTVNAFNGPLDLLLFLIRRAEVDIQDIPISQITDHYVAFLRELDDIDIDLAGEFLVMAATLIEIKSRTIVPVARVDGEGDIDDPLGSQAADPRFELIQQLLAYQRFRTAAESLVDRRMAFVQRYPSLPARRSYRDEDPDELPELELEDVHVLDLSEAYERIVSSIDLSRLGDHMVEMDDTPLALHQEDLMDRLQHAHEGKLTLQDTFDGYNSSQRVGLFLATLELVRQRRILVHQPESHHNIEIELLDGKDALQFETDDATEATEATTEVSA